MPYFHSNDIHVLFLHVPKTGGTSIEEYLSAKYDIPLSPKSLYDFLPDDIQTSHHLSITSSLQHMSYQTIHTNNHYFHVDFEHAQLITVVRNPYQRAISDLFFYHKMNKHTSPEEVYTLLQSHIPHGIDNHTLPQYTFLVTDENNTLLPNLHILHTETLDEDMHALGYTDFQHRVQCNPTKVNYMDYLNHDSIRYLNTVYARDFDMFQYPILIP